MRRTLTAVASILLLLGSTGIAGAQETPAPLVELLEQWEMAFNAGDYAALAALYTEDGRRMSPTEGIITGREEIAESSAQFAGFTIQLGAYGGLLDKKIGSTWGMYQLSGMVDGEAVEIEGRWMNAVKMTAEGWKIHRDIWHEIDLELD
ncbi:MAG: YybH family protein [Gemmatimonadota bacterium]